MTNLEFYNIDLLKNDLKVLRHLYNSTTKRKFSCYFEIKDHVDKLKNSESMINLILTDPDYLWCRNKLMIFDVFMKLYLDLIERLDFVIEAINLQKPNIAFSLLRVPIKDNLFIIEMMYIDFEEFIKRACSTDVKYNLSMDDVLKNKDKEYIKKIIEKSVTNINKFNFYLNGELLYDLRYNKEKEFCLERYWEKHLHIVTNNKYYPTRDEVINVNVRVRDRRKEVKLLLYLLPQIIYYYIILFLNIYQEHFRNDFKIFEDNFNKFSLYHHISFVESTKLLPKSLLFKISKIDCSSCHKEYYLNKKERKQLIKNRYYICSCGCKNKLFIDKIVSC